MRRTRRSSRQVMPAMPHMLVQEAGLAVPGGRSGEAFLEADAGLVAELPAGALDREGAVLPEPVHATPEERRLLGERLVDRLARQGREPERAERQVTDLHADAQRLADGGDEVV